MRLLHTSDWHVGRTIGGRSRLDEFEAVLDDVVRIATSERVDVVLIAGDVFDQRAANPEAERLVYLTLTRLVMDGAAVVIIPGNHDSAPRWHALRPLLDPMKVHVVPFWAPPESGSLVEIASREGTEAALVACVPFVPERMLGTAAALFAGSERWAQEYAQGMGDLLAAMAEGFRGDRVNLLMAHLFATDVALGGGENPLTVTLDYAVSPARFPHTAQYIALGHVHRPQAVAASPAPARYSGSLLQLDFGETEQQKSVTLVDATPGKPARVRPVPLTAGRRLVDVEGTLAEVIARAAEVGDAWLRVVVHSDAPVPGLADEVRELLPYAVEVHPEHPREDEEAPTSGLVRLHPRDQYLSYYRTKKGADAPAELVAAFAETYEAIRGSEA